MPLSNSSADPTGSLNVAQNATTEVPRTLTYDEKKAAEAAFRGEPFNPAWSTAARRVYEGILVAKGVRALESLTDEAVDVDCVVG
jgi:hypothetical protein